MISRIHPKTECAVYLLSMCVYGGVCPCLCAWCVYVCLFLHICMREPVCPINSGSTKVLLALPGIQHESSVSVVRVVLNMNVRVS